MIRAPVTFYLAPLLFPNPSGMSRYCMEPWTQGSSILTLPSPSAPPVIDCCPESWIATPSQGPQGPWGPEGLWCDPGMGKLESGWCLEVRKTMKKCFLQGERKALGRSEMPTCLRWPTRWRQDLHSSGWSSAIPASKHTQYQWQY